VDPAVLERMRTDAARVARLGNPHVAGSVEVGVSEDGRVYSILDPCTGTDLASLLRTERRLEGARAVDIATQLGRALGAAHGVGVRHGQLEPERVLVTATPGGDEVRVLDLGLGEGAGAADLISAHYRAPEQHLGQPSDERADVYALGAILYEMVTGAPPSAGRKLTEPVQSPRMFRPEIPMELERLILASLDRDPARRPPNMAAFEEALGSVSRTRDASAGAARAAHPATAGQERRRARREAAFHTIGELVSMANAPTPLPGPVTPPPSRSSSSRPSLRPLDGHSNGQVEGPRERTTSSSAPDWTPSPSFGGNVLARYGATPGNARWRLVRQLLLVAGAIGVAAALVSRFLR
jgi:eukaryotic-like serine/threonine-protein kinase